MFLRELILKTEIWPVAGSFIISRSSLKEITVVTVEIREGNTRGRGECRPYARYNETPKSVTQQIETLRTEIENSLTLQQLQELMPAGAARNAVDCALWDLKAKQTGKPISKLLGVPEPRPRLTAYTLSIASPKKMRQAALKAKNYPLLKIKIGGMDGLEACLAIMEARPDAQLIIDANEALQGEDAIIFRDRLSAFPVVMIEQPVADKIFDHIPNVPSSLPIFCADESLHGAQDLAKLWTVGYRAINVKLDKCGGLSGGVALMRAAKAQGFIIMAGCMVGTSLAMAPMMCLEGFADYIDLDGPLLLAKDRKDGLKYEDSAIWPPAKEFWG